MRYPGVCGPWLFALAVGLTGALGCGNITSPADQDGGRDGAGSGGAHATGGATGSGGAHAGTGGSGAGTGGRGSGGAVGTGGAGSGGLSGTGGAGAGGAGGDSGAGGSGICGGFSGMQCRGDEWCDFPDNGLCGAADASGVCRARPSICPQVCSRVCGCDGRAYCNACIASQQGVDVSGQSSSGTCP